MGGSSHASLWSGTAASWVDLNPAGSVSSTAYAVGGGQQAGYAIVGGSSHASLWSGTAASWVDLNPAGSTDSTANAINGGGGGQQAGYAYVGGLTHASLWSGTAASWVDLHAFLPAGFSTNSTAQSVWSDASFIYVAGYGYNSLTGHYEALLWTHAITPPPPTVDDLHPAGASNTWSRAYGASGTQQAGYVTVSLNTDHASLWSGTAASWVDLNPANSGYSTAFGVSGGQQVGYSAVPGVSACLWSGTAASWVNLNPAGFGGSIAYATSGTQQVGFANRPCSHASLWSGTAASWVDLHPNAGGCGGGGANYSIAWGVSGGQQVGEARVSVVGGDSNHASLWTGSAASWVDLNPAGADASYAYGVSAGTQVGWARYFSFDHAGLWTGSAASWIDLNPAGASSSIAYGAFGSRQVGYAVVSSGGRHAVLWSGTAASWVDLHLLLPAGFQNSTARGIWSDGTITRVAGYGTNNLTGRDEALVWTLGNSIATSGACCQGTSCTATTQAACTGTFLGTSAVCGTAGNPTTCCPANFDDANGLDVQDIFSFLAAWFAGDPRADFNGAGGIDVQDIFDFLAAWFAGCP